MNATVDVNFVTWPNHPKRMEYFRGTVAAIAEYLYATRHTIRFHCSAESERDPRHPWLGDELEQVCRRHNIQLAWRDGPANLGANMNAALRLGGSPTVLLVQDDWLLLRELDLSPGVDFMEAGSADLLRYSFPDWDVMRPTMRAGPDDWLRIDVRGRWPYGDDPHLRRRDFMDRWDWYLEGGGHGSASATLMRQLVAGRADIAVAAETSYFRHFGDVTAVLDDQRHRRITREDC